MFLHGQGRQRFYRFPEEEDIGNIAWKEVLATTETTMAKKGTSMTIPKEDKDKADKELKLYTGK